MTCRTFTFDSAPASEQYETLTAKLVAYVEIYKRKDIPESYSKFKVQINSDWQPNVILSFIEKKQVLRT